MDPQTGIYALAYMQRFGELPSFVLYDVVRKPTIEPKRLEKKDLARLNKELLAQGVARYYDELFDMSMLEWPLEEGRESIALYGARLTADIGDRPGYYFARRTVDRIAQDFEALRADLGDQMELLELAGSMGLRPRNPDACFEFGRPCDFFALCSHNEQPREGQPIPPGYRQREHKHPELAD
jgi:hypothetical protein